MNKLYQDASLCPRFTDAANIRDLAFVAHNTNARKMYIKLASIELERRVRSSFTAKRDLNDAAGAMMMLKRRRTETKPSR